MENNNFEVLSEEKFLNLLGFEIEKTGQGTWTIRDSRDYIAGSIHKMRVENGSEETVNMVHTMVDYGNLKCVATRNASDQNFSYKFTIQVDIDDFADIEVRLGKTPKLAVKFNGELISYFELDYNQLKLFYKTSDNKYNNRHTMYMSSSKPGQNGKFDNNLSYVLKLERSSRDGKEAACSELAATEMDANTLLLVTSHKRPSDGSYVTRKELVDGNVVDLLGKCEESIAAFQEYKDLINKTLPFKENIVEKMLRSGLFSNIPTYALTPDSNQLI